MTPSRFPSPLPFLVATILLLSLLAGCAAVDRNLSLTYAPPERPLGRRDATVVVARIETPTTSRNSRGEWLVGSLNNVHGVHEADLLTDRDPGRWIGEALMLELKQDGYNVTAATSPPADAPLALRLGTVTTNMAVNRGMVTSDIKHELRIGVELLARGALVKNFSVASRSSRTVFLSPSTQELESVMLQAVQDALQQVMAEVHAQADGK